MTNNRVTAGILLVEGREEEVAGDVVGVVIAHVDFATDDVSLSVEVFFGQGWVKDEFEENFEDSVRGVGRAVDVIDRSVEAGVGVPLSAQLIDGIGEL